MDEIIVVWNISTENIPTYIYYLFEKKTGKLLLLVVIRIGLLECLQFVLRGEYSFHPISNTITDIHRF